MRLLIIGDGRMGRAIDALARDRGHDVIAVLGKNENDGASWLTPERAVGVDVAIEFTEPSAARDNVWRCIERGVAVVSGTTGWSDELAQVESETRRRNGALFWAPNFSLGVALATEAIRAAGALFGAHSQFDAHIVETHHAAKKDAPSGTGASIRDALGESLGRPVDISSIRVGHVPGTHTVIFDGAFEQITITHEARDRRVFADGALRAAEWLVGRHGVFTMHDLLFAPEGS
ncbi:MAG: dihydrodipicolinate reductase C-terminal domain-containing protein [Gemmatimonadaceae bacterium]